MTATTTSGIKAFPQLDMDLPLRAATSMSSERNWLVFSVARPQMDVAAACNFVDLSAYVNF
jgi:hypothetical protein